MEMEGMKLFLPKGTEHYWYLLKMIVSIQTDLVMSRRELSIV